MSTYDFLSRFPRPAARLIASAIRSKGIAVYQTKWSHHAKHSGYYAIADGLGLVIANDAAVLPSAIAKFGRTNLGTGAKRKAAEIDLLMSWFSRKCLLIVDGDFNLPLMKALYRPDGRTIVPVFHQPPDVLERILLDFPPNFSDRAVCVARCQVPYVERLLGEGRVAFIPHGIDCEWFTPSGVRSESPVFLCTGVHRRNLLMLSRIAERLKVVAPEILIKMVLPRKHFPPEMDTTNIDVEFDVSDDRLLNLYRTSWGLVMPVEAATANNAILESLACGTPVIATRCPGVSDYVTDECGFLCEDEPDAYVRAILSLAVDPKLRERMGRAARQVALALDWPKIRARVRDYLERPLCSPMC